MFDGFSFDGFGLLFLLALAAGILYMIKNLIGRYRAANYAILRTHITVYELQKMIENRRVCKS